MRPNSLNLTAAAISSDNKEKPQDAAGEVAVAKSGKAKGSKTNCRKDLPGAAQIAAKRAEYLRKVREHVARAKNDPLPNA